MRSRATSWTGPPRQANGLPGVGRAGVDRWGGPAIDRCPARRAVGWCGPPAGPVHGCRGGSGGTHRLGSPGSSSTAQLTGPGAVVVRDGRIADVLDHVPSRAPHHTELRDGLLSAGLVDLQVNGFAGTDLIAADDAGWDDVRRRLPATGVTAFVATYITAPLPDLLDGLRRATRAADRRVADGARLLGVHLEGPFLSAARRGAHDAALMTDPHPDAVEAILAAGPPAIVTLAPERATASAPSRACTRPASSCPWGAPTRTPSRQPPGSTRARAWSPICSTRCVRCTIAHPVSPEWP